MIVNFVRHKKKNKQLCQKKWLEIKTRESKFSIWHPHTVISLLGGVALVSAITLWPLVWCGCAARVREQTHLFLLEPAEKVNSNFKTH
jgi:hypothetical protein